jgi:hypothetical protein
MLASITNTRTNAESAVALAAAAVRAAERASDARNAALALLPETEKMRAHRIAAMGAAFGH